MRIQTTQAHSVDYIQDLDECKNFADVFEIVKKGVRAAIGKRRTGLMLYLAQLPLQVGAYHEVGSNSIVMNSSLLKIVEKNAKSVREVNSFVFSILLHEYLHSLGYLNEPEVRRLVYIITNHVLGQDHPATRIAQYPSEIFLQAQSLGRPSEPEEPRIIKDFERSDQPYIV